MVSILYKAETTHLGNWAVSIKQKQFTLGNKRFYKKETANLSKWVVSETIHHYGLTRHGRLEGREPVSEPSLSSNCIKLYIMSLHCILILQYFLSDNVKYIN